MSISNTTTDYTGRLQDIYISGQLSPLSPVAQPVLYSFGSSTKFVAGVQKLIQRYLISLVNSGFVEDLQGMSGNNIIMAKNTFGIYNADIITGFRSYQNSNPSQFPDEQLNTVQLINLTSNGSSLSFSLLLTTQAGTSLSFLMPLPLS